MKKLAFVIIVALDVIALILAGYWYVATPGYEPALAAILVVANLASLLYTRPHWIVPTSHTQVVQTKNVVGGDLSGRDINKKTKR